MPLNRLLAADAAQAPAHVPAKARAVTVFRAGAGIGDRVHQIVTVSVTVPEQKGNAARISLKTSIRGLHEQPPWGNAWAP